MIKQEWALTRNIEDLFISIKNTTINIRG